MKIGPGKPAPFGLQRDVRPNYSLLQWAYLAIIVVVSSDVTKQDRTIRKGPEVFFGKFNF
jgi:hypothetical protein